MIAVQERRLSVREYLALWGTHYKKYWKYYLVGFGSLVLLQTVFRIDINYTNSLPDHVYITIKGYKSNIKTGDYVAYKFPTDSPITLFRKGDHMVKIIAGVEGDEVRRDENGNFSILRKTDSQAMHAMGGFSAGKAKPTSREGRPLTPGPTGTIPAGHYYVYAPNPDSLDSRYSLVSWINDDDIIGKTYPLF